MRLRAVASVVIVLGIMLVASVALAQYPQEGVGLGSTDTWVMNVHETLDANVVASFIDQDGQQTWSTESTIAPLGNDSFPASSSELESGWLGSMTIDSLRPIASVAETVWQGVPRGDGWSAAAYIDAAEGAPKIFFPDLCKTDYWRSIITIQCLDTEECLVSMTYRDREDGDTVPGGPFLDTIQPFSQETYDLWDPSVNPHVPDDAQMPTGWFGSLEATSDQEIAGVARNHAKPAYASAYNGIPASTATTVYFASLNRNNDNNWSGNSEYSILLVQNTNAFGVTLYVSFYDRDGNLELGFQEAVDAYETAIYNMKTDARFANLENPFLGAAVITSSHPIVGACRFVRVPNDGLSGAYAGVGDGSRKLVFPVAYRAKEGGTWRKYSGVIVQNLDPENEITVWTHWYRDNGSFVITIPYDIAANGSHGFNTRYGEHAGDLSALGGTWAGTVVVTTTSPLGVAGVVQSTITYPDYAYLTLYGGIAVE